jgi:nucleoid-associated protein YgaU
LGLASDEEFTDALETASSVEIEMVTGRIEQPQEDIVAHDELIPEEPVSGEPDADAEYLAKTDADAEYLAKTDADTEPPVLTEAEEQEILDLGLDSNEYFLESQRLAQLAQEIYDYGDYDASEVFAREAIRFAELSDEYVAQHLGTTQEAADGIVHLPATYTVRPWATTRDCFWNIAAYPWVYGNPRLWRILYNANRSKLPDPNNPNLIEVGTVLDIPSIRGEIRQGAWDSSKTYPPLN